MLVQSRSRAQVQCESRRAAIDNHDRTGCGSHCDSAGCGAFETNYSCESGADRADGSGTIWNRGTGQSTLSRRHGGVGQSGFEDLPFQRQQVVRSDQEGRLYVRAGIDQSGIPCRKERATPIGAIGECTSDLALTSLGLCDANTTVR